MTPTPLDLPDPLHPPTAGPPGRADDLLSQMADDEINRLLAQADVEPAAAPGIGAPAADAATASAPPAAADAMGAADLFGLPGGSAEGSAVPLSDEALSQELDQVFAGQVSAGPAAAGGTTGTDAVSTDGVSDLLGRLAGGERPADAERPAKTDRHDFDPDGDDQPGHEVPANAAEGAGAAAVAAARTGPRSEASEAAVTPGSEPIRRRLLRWLVLPLDPFPDGARDVIGKVAIVTTVNAIAVLIYVLIFR